MYELEKEDLELPIEEPIKGWVFEVTREIKEDAITHIQFKQRFDPNLGGTKPWPAFD